MSTDALSLDAIQPQQLRAVARNRRSFWLATFLLGLLLAAGGVAAVTYGQGMGETLPAGVRMALRLGAALAPGLIWLGIFALFARGDHALVRAGLLVWLVTAVFYLVTVQPLLTRVIQIDNWLFMGWWASILADFFIVAPLELLLLYLILRFGVYPTPIFQRMVDGPIFGMAAGLGLAAMLGAIATWRGEVLSWQQGLLTTGAWALSYATLGAWLGFFLARSRFTQTHPLYLAGGFLLTVFFHTLFFALELGFRALSPFVPLYSHLIATSSLAFLGFLILYWRIRKHNNAFLAMADRIEAEQAPHADAEPRPLLADVLRMAELHGTETAPPPRPMPEERTSAELEEDELASLKRSWEALIAEQENS